MKRDVATSHSSPTADDHDVGTVPQDHGRADAPGSPGGVVVHLIGSRSPWGPPGTGSRSKRITTLRSLSSELDEASGVRQYPW